MRGKNLFLTYPQCPVAKEPTLEKVIETFEDLDFAIVAEEMHKDGTPHLHVVVALKKQVQLNGAKGMAVLRSLTGQHGNYQIARKLQDTVRYVVKDGNVVSTGINIKTYLKACQDKTSTKAARAETTLMNGGTITDVRKQMSGFTLMHLEKLQRFVRWRDLEEMRKQIVQPGEFEYACRNLDHGGAKIAGWLQENLFEKRDFKQKQLFLFGDPNMGKTSLINDLCEIGVRVYFMPYEDFYDAFDDDCYDLIVLDEFKGQKRIQDLNMWLDGSRFPVRRKGTAPFLKTKNLPFIIISNYKLEDCYNVGETRLAPLQTRLKQVEVSQFIEIDCVKVQQAGGTSQEAAPSLPDTIPIEDLPDPGESFSLGSQDTDDDF